jgi:hypothetical protein
MLSPPRRTPFLTTGLSPTLALQPCQSLALTETLDRLPTLPSKSTLNQLSIQHADVDVDVILIVMPEPGCYTRASKVSTQQQQNQPPSSAHSLQSPTLHSSLTTFPCSCFFFPPVTHQANKPRIAIRRASRRMNVPPPLSWPSLELETQPTLLPRRFGQGSSNTRSE